MSNIVDNGVLNGNVNYILQTGQDDPDHVAQRGLHVVTGYFALPDRRLYRPRYAPDVFKRVQTFSNPELDKFSPASLITAPPTISPRSNC